ncbi:hypothetical protein [Streptomyces sp. NPDC048312]|uniref:hypothetical protein n=1 Tax=Streptomyces sp. NPDC048312 TaxID=3155485 RepID=UPI0033FAB54B
MPAGRGDQRPQLYAFDNHLAYTVLDGLGLLPNLRRITGAGDCGTGTPFKEEILAARGIVSD